MKELEKSSTPEMAMQIFMVPKHRKKISLQQVSIEHRRDAPSVVAAGGDRTGRGQGNGGAYSYAAECSAEIQQSHEDWIPES
jgi:hypothetical protein